MIESIFGTILAVWFILTGWNGIDERIDNETSN